MPRMQRLKQVFNIDSEVCEHFGGHVKAIAGIRDQLLEDEPTIEGSKLDLLSFVSVTDNPSGTFICRTFNSISSTLEQ